jgi:hypothetical protein
LIEPAIRARVGSTPAAAEAFVVSTDIVSGAPLLAKRPRAASQGSGNQRLYAVETAAIMVNGALRAFASKKPHQALNISVDRPTYLQ